MKRLFDEIKLILKENKYFLIMFFIGLVLLNINLPFYIEKDGGLLNLNDRVSINNNFNNKGSLNMTYVSTLNGNFIFNLISLFNDWDIIKKEEENGTSTEKEREFGDKLALQDSIDTAKIVAFKKAQKEIDILSQDVYIGYIYEESNTDLKVGDILIKINDTMISSKNDVSIEINKHSVGDVLNIEVKNNKKIYQRQAKIIDIGGKKAIGILCYSKYKLKTNPNVLINFQKKETGPSGGLMLALTIYSKITKKDKTNGMKIAGTGVIDEYGNVGEIGGVKYKLAGAVKEKADVFIVPKDNYKEAIKEKKKNNYIIYIYKEDTFDDAINILKKLE